MSTNLSETEEWEVCLARAALQNFLFGIIEMLLDYPRWRNRAKYEFVRYVAWLTPARDSCKRRGKESDREKLRQVLAVIGPGFKRWEVVFRSSAEPDRRSDAGDGHGKGSGRLTSVPSSLH